MVSPRAHAPYPALRDGQSFKILGLGGIGQWLAQLVVRFLDATGRRARVVLIDGDVYSDADGNRSRMQTTARTPHTNKALVTRDLLVPMFPGSALSITAVPEYLRPDNADRLIAEGDIVLAAVDNNQTRKLLFSVTRRDLTIISGGNDGIGVDSQGTIRHGTYGSVSVYIVRDGVPLCPNPLAIHPELANPTDAAPGTASCTQALASTPQILFTNATVASAVANSLLLVLRNQLHYSELALDIAKGRMAPQPLARPKQQ